MQESFLDSYSLPNDFMWSSMQHFSREVGTAPSLTELKKANGWDSWGCPVQGQGQELDGWYLWDPSNSEYFLSRISFYSLDEEKNLCMTRFNVHEHRYCFKKCFMHVNTLTWQLYKIYVCMCVYEQEHKLEESLFPSSMVKIWAWLDTD